MIDRLFVKINKFVPEKWKWILEHEGFKKYFKNTGWMFFGQMFSLLVSFFVGAWLARYLGPENYGIVNYVVAFVSMFGFIAHLGVYSVLLRDLIEGKEKDNELMGSSFFILFAGSILAFLTSIISSFIFEDSALIRSLIILYSCTFLFSPFSIITTFFQSRIEAKRNVRISIFLATISSVLKLLIILSGKGIIYLIGIFVLESLLLAILNVFVYKRSGFKLSSWKINFKLSRGILFSSSFLMLASAASYIFTRIDQVIIKSFLGEVAVGIYSAALKLVEIWYFIPGIICTSLLAAVINAKNNNYELYRSRLKKLYILLGSISFLIAVFLTIFSRQLILFLFGSSYYESIFILKIYAWAGVGLFLSTGLYQHLLADNKLKTIFYFYLFLMIVNIILNFIFIPIIGLTGAAWATLVSYFLSGIFIVFIKK